MGSGLALVLSGLFATGQLAFGQQINAIAASAVVWVVLGVALAKELAHDPLQGMHLRFHQGQWFVIPRHSPGITPESAELPCEITLLADVQHNMLVRLKVAAPWVQHRHWFWFNRVSVMNVDRLANARATPALPARGSQWLSLRHALVWSKQHP